uniref:Uncharacterized protein n=1 Tax=Ananas comosus var. bracteatus TaxID=296719 RepID=A0A6V7QBF3_ANACO|nr:unnamed protein product [Ananas comosus var. bracteatus]
MSCVEEARAMAPRAQWGSPRESAKMLPNTGSPRGPGIGTAPLRLRLLAHVGPPGDSAHASSAADSAAAATASTTTSPRSQSNALAPRKAGSAREEKGFFLRRAQGDAGCAVDQKIALVRNSQREMFTRWKLYAVVTGYLFSSNFSGVRCQLGAFGLTNFVVEVEFGTLEPEVESR